MYDNKKEKDSMKMFHQIAENERLAKKALNILNTVKKGSDDDNSVSVYNAMEQNSSLLISTNDKTQIKRYEKLGLDTSLNNTGEVAILSKSDFKNIVSGFFTNKEFSEMRKSNNIESDSDRSR